MTASVCTFTLLAREPATGNLGVATASCCLAVGAVVPFLRPGVGAIAVQNLPEPRIAFEVLDDLEAGVEPKDALDRALRFFGDPARRQVAVFMTTPQAGQTPYCACTGAECEPVCGQIVTEDLIVIGNGLAGQGVLAEIERHYRANTAPVFGARLVDALLAGQRAGGDRAGKQSAALKVIGTQSFQPPLVDLRVDNHPDATTELAHLWTLFCRQPQSPGLSLPPGQEPK